MDISKRIQTKRKAMGMSVESLAAMAGCSTARIRQFECGDIPTNSNHGTFGKVKRILHVKDGWKKKSKVVAKVHPKTPKPVKVEYKDDSAKLVSNLHEAITKLTVTVSALTAALAPKANNPVVPKPVIITNALDKQQQKSEAYPWGAPTKVAAL